MAEGILSDIAAGIIESLESPALKEVGLLWGVTDELEKLKNTISIIQAVLLDAEEQRAVNSEVRDWLKRLEDVVYDADDLLDAFSTEFLLREMMTRDKMAKKVRIFFAKSNKLVFSLKMRRQIKAIRQELDAIVNDRTKFHLEERPTVEGVRARKRDDTHSFVLEAVVVGREDDKKEIIKRLLSNSDIKENVGILPITGIGGLGKTILAQFIFNDREIDKHFQLKLWACVSESFDVKEIVEKILESAREQKPCSAEMDTSVHNLRKEIGGKKYFLVLDDVWNEDVKKWDDLKVLLEVGASGSRILITTRSKKVAQITQTIAEYSLQRLDEQESWCLFKQVAFENGEEPVNSRKVEVGKEIVEKCSGVPLVINTIGRLLFLEDSEAGWDSFEKNKMAKIKENEILPSLKLSYDQLPSQLKQCFAYCSIFPKDYVMEKSKLINLWIAQGFIKPSNQNECLEDVGHGYFMDLLWRSFFQEVQMDDLGNVITGKMHDLMHDLAISVAGSWIAKVESEEKTIGILETRHISVVNNIDFSFVIPTSSSKVSRIRTLFSYDKFGGLSTSTEAIFSSLKSLRVLDLHGKGLDMVPSSICKLKHLRYLDLSWNYQIEKLPDSISRLQNLHTLILSYCYGLKELPRGITKLANLRHLYNDRCDNLTYIPRGLGQLTNLQTLSKFVVHFDSAPEDSGWLSELNRLDSLRLGELKISELRHGEDVALNCKDANLKKKKHLQVLRLRWSTKNVDARDEKVLEVLEPHPNLKKLYMDYYGGVSVPILWLLSLANLVHLSLGNCRKLKYLPPLSRLHSLKSVHLKCLDEIEYISDCSDNNEFSSSSSSAVMEFFPSLEVISLQNCPNLKGWWSDSLLILSFPRLSSLTIWGCPMLTLLPMFPHLKEDLYLSSASWKPVQQTMMNNVNLSTTVEASSSSSASSIPIDVSSAPLSKLKEIRLMHIGDIETLMPEDGLQNLISLQFLEISDCPRLKSLSQGIQYLTALHELKLIDCPALDLSNDEHGMQWKGLKSLISLEFQSIPKLVSLPLGLQHVTTLRQFQILNCSSFIAIPEWISNWASLEVFTINSCSGLKSLPEAMEGLSSLKMLTIYDCPILVQRCEKKRGEDWHKIAHIPKRNIYRYGNMI